MPCEHCQSSKQPEDMTKDELIREVVDTADLPEMSGTASYGFRKQHFVELVRFLRAENGTKAEGSVDE